MFTESSPIAAGAKPYDAEPMKACAYCGASLADDQRYCLECGGRQVQARSQFLSRFTPATVSGPTPSSGGAAAGGAGAGGGRSSGATAVAGVGVLLLAMGVGVLIGRAGAGKTTTTPAQVISVATPGAAASGTSNGAAPAVTTPAESPSSSSTGAGTKWRRLGIDHQRRWQRLVLHNQTQILHLHQIVLRKSLPRAAPRIAVAARAKPNRATAAKAPSRRRATFPTW